MQVTRPLQGCLRLQTGNCCVQTSIYYITVHKQALAGVQTNKQTNKQKNKEGGRGGWFVYVANLYSSISSESQQLVVDFSQIRNATFVLVLS